MKKENNVTAALQLGKLTFCSNIIQAPLAGVSCAPFRRLAWQHGRPAFCFTEMISCKTLINKPLFAQRRFIYKDPQEGPLCFQISGNNVNEVGRATQIATEHGADLIDLNCGCPVKKIRIRGAGSSLLQNPDQLQQLIVAMRANTHVPISIKIRVEGRSPFRFNETLVQVINDSPLDFVTVHGRHWTEHYETPCQHEQIKYFVDRVKIPVIGNGDIACLTSLNKMLATGCAGVMIGRASVGQPWLTRQLLMEHRGELFKPYDSNTIGKIFLEHISDLIKLLGQEKFAIFQARKFAKYYGRHLEDKNDFIKAINSCESFAELKNSVRKHLVLANSY